MNFASQVSKNLVVAGRLEGRTAVITGGAGGMGRAAARLFAEAGARVAILDIQAENGRETVAEIEAAGGEALFFETDVSDTKSVRDAVARIVKTWGRIDTLFSHAGTIIVKPLHESTDTGPVPPCLPRWSTRFRRWFMRPFLPCVRFPTSRWNWRG